MISISSMEMLTLVGSQNTKVNEYINRKKTDSYGFN